MRKSTSENRSRLKTISTRFFLLTTLPCLVVFILAAVDSSGSKTVPVRVDRWLEIQQMAGPVTLYRGQASQPARVGLRLQAVGDGIKTGSKATAVLATDTGIGTISVSEQTSLRIQTLQIAPGNGRITRLQVTGGQVRLKVRPFTNPGSRLEIQTPAGVSGVRGTEFGVSIQPDGKTGLATLSGSVVSNALGKAIAVNGGFQNLVVTGEPPSPAVPLRNDTSLKIEIRKEIKGNVRWARLIGQIDFVNGLTIAGQPQITDRNGRFDLTLPVSSQARVQAVVTTPLGKKQVYDLATW